MVRALRILLAGTMVAGATGCASTPITVPELKAEDVPAMTALGNYPDQIYKIEPGDTVLIRYVYHPEMKQEDVVRPDGKITANLIGELIVSGMTVRELERTLAERTAEQLRNPEVVVSISKFAEKTVFVGGEVIRPGTMPYKKGLTPMQAVMASGPSSTPNRLRIHVAAASRSAG